MNTIFYMCLVIRNIFSCMGMDMSFAIDLEVLLGFIHKPVKRARGKEKF